MDNEKPKMVSISVVLPVYNTSLTFLEEAIESILKQTFQDFELIIIDDGSTGDIRNFLHSLQDSRIKVIRNSENIGITKSLNIGFREAKGKYIARMDSDDISLPNRLERQYIYMETHPKVIVCGANVECFGENTRHTKHQIKDMEAYRIKALFRNPGPMHPTAFFNRELLLRYHILYDEEFQNAEDYGLWIEIIKYGEIHILSDELLRYREHSNQISQAHRETQIKSVKKIQRKQLEQLVDEISEEELDIHFRYGTWYCTDCKINKKMLEWFYRLMKANEKKRIYDKKMFNHYVQYEIILRAVYQSFEPRMTFYQKTAFFLHNLPISLVIKLWLGLILRKCNNTLLKYPRKCYTLV